MKNRVNGEDWLASRLVPKAPENLADNILRSAQTIDGEHRNKTTVARVFSFDNISTQSFALTLAMCFMVVAVASLMLRTTGLDPEQLSVTNPYTELTKAELESVLIELEMEEIWLLQDELKELAAL